MSHPFQMKGVLLTGFGGFDKLKYREDLIVPEPAAGDVLVKVGACGVNNTDIWTRDGAYGHSIDQQAQSGWRGGTFQFPRIQGADIVGHIIAVGDGVPESRMNERVIVNPTLYKGNREDSLYHAGLIGSERDGGFAEYATVPAENALAIDTGLSDAELATFMVSYLTAEHMLNRGRVSKNDRVLVTGASGGVGSALVQLAKRRGAQVIAVVGKGKDLQVRSIGADVICIRGANLHTCLRNSEIGTVDVVVDIVAGSQTAELLDVLSPGGRFVTAGAIAGSVTEFDWRKVYLKHLDILGSTMGTRQEAEDLIRYITASEIQPLLSETYPISEMVQAQTSFLEKQFFGNIVLIP
ncbi:alcohol dehydrogenase family protein [Nitrospira sp. M1]